MVDVFDVAPPHDTRPQAVRQVQRVDEDVARRIQRVLHPGVQPFHERRYALQMLAVVAHGECACVLVHREGSVRVGLRQMDDGPQLAHGRRDDVATNEGVDQRRPSDPRDALDEERIEAAHRVKRPARLGAQH